MAKKLKNDQYNKQVRRKDSETVFCQYCSRYIKVGNMGNSALKSHILGKRHKERTLSLFHIALSPHQDRSNQKVKNLNEPASKETISNEPAKKK